MPVGAPEPRIDIIDYTPSDLIRLDDVAVLDIERFLQTPSVTWIDVQGLGNERILLDIADLFGLHPLVIADVVNVPQRPKFEAYDTFGLMIVRMPRLQAGKNFEPEQISVIVGDTYVLTFQEQYGDVFDVVRDRIAQGKGPIRRSGPDYLAYALIDTIIDSYYPLLETFGERLEQLEGDVLSDPSAEHIAEVHEVKRELISVRRAVWPQREAVNAFMRWEDDRLTDSVVVYLRDCYDHCVQVMDVVESYREMAGGLLDVYMSSVSNRMNEVMKVLTMMASVFIPLTFIAGVYGMNFQFMPELHQRYAYPLVIVLMAVIAAGWA